MYQELRSDDQGRKETRSCIEQSEASLFSDICQMSEVPRHEIIYLMIRSRGRMDRIGEVFPMKDPPFNVSFGQDRDFLGEFELC